MVRIYQQSERAEGVPDPVTPDKGEGNPSDERSAIEYIEKELGLQNVYLLGIRADNNYVIVYKYKGDIYSGLKIADNDYVIEDDIAPIYFPPEKEICQRYEAKNDRIIESVEKDLRLRGVYVFGIETGIDSSSRVVVVHRGRKSKEIYLDLFGYGIVSDGMGGRINICSLDEEQS